MNKFLEAWKKNSVYTKTHDKEVQELLDNVKDQVHQMDERLDTYETASGEKKSQKDIGEWYIVRTNGMEFARFPSKKEAEQMCEELKAQGQFSTMVHETIVGDTTKAAPVGDWKVGSGEKFNIYAEYKDVNGSIQYRWFASDAEMKQFEQEMKGELELKSMARGLSKTVVEKPAKFDRCVSHVKESSPDANAYAVCNSMISEKSFENMEENAFHGLIDKALSNMGIASGGPMPRSTFSQSSSSEDSRKSYQFTPIRSLVSRIAANQKRGVGKVGSFKDYWSKTRATNKL